MNRQLYDRIEAVKQYAVENGVPDLMEWVGHVTIASEWLAAAVEVLDLPAEVADWTIPFDQNLSV